VRVEFDPSVISYAQLLQVFWDSHDPSSAPYLRQYRNAIFYLDERQRQFAEQSRDVLREKTGRPVGTAIEAVGKFTPAEDYHQKYYLRRAERLMRMLRERYSDREQLLASTAATRINGYLGCFGEPQSLATEVGSLGLPGPEQRELLDYLTSACREFKDVGCALPAAR
jgi:peptide-methionine (S)-S-oxide reductase